MEVFETNWKINHFREQVNRNRFKLIFTSRISRSDNQKSNENYHDFYIQMIYQIYDNSEWKKVKLSEIEYETFDEIAEKIIENVKKIN